MPHGSEVIRGDAIENCGEWSNQCIDPVAPGALQSGVEVKAERSLGSI